MVLRLLDHGGMLRWTALVNLTGSMDQVDPEHPIWTHADNCNHCSNSIHVHCSELLLFSSMMLIVVVSGFLL